jgi:hypothetical protein
VGAYFVSKRVRIFFIYPKFAPIAVFGASIMGVTMAKPCKKKICSWLRIESSPLCCGFHFKKNDTESKNLIIEKKRLLYQVKLN